ncbi:DUF4178 domain-containing protein [Eikenella longinqua]|uniref:DUF4178 domain-containing protein n=1 Tax=Eikenella longinqua TaxID=1795827 RepID=A0A1A9S334_9NEIS|nr:DUF4178 domain-containing protein [Eikenella longinqua]OAM31507.1 DUF4178 domain-containing protein [Eikenella longinqua]
MSEPFFQTDCPSCGAPVHAHSATAVTLVCGFCHSLLVRQGAGIIDSGRDSALLEDFSPLQIGTAGTFAAQPFSIIGRLQAKYEAGLWNEWYVQFADGSNGWLSEAGDQYVFTLPAAEPLPDTPEFDNLVPGHSNFVYQGKRFWAADVRDIVLEQAAAEGELPFELPPQMKNRVADWRCEQAFLTLDYAESPPEAFIGRGVNLADLQLSNTRSSAEVAGSAGKLKGTRQAESCPNCGSPVQWITGLTPSILCPSCGSSLDAAEGKLELLEANNRRAAQADAFTLKLGAEATINNRTYTLIGAVRKDELEPGDAFNLLFGKNPSGITPEGSWTEYLLFEPQAGFMWLVESDGEWSVSETLNVWPRLQGELFQPQGLPKLYDYGGRVVLAAGAFYWHIRQGDVDFYSDYRQNGNGKLCAERNRHEAAWSQSTPVSYRQVREWFGLSGSDVPQYSADMRADGPSKGLMLLLVAVFVIINLPAWFSMLSSDEDISLAGTVSVMVLYFLAKRGDVFSGGGDDDDDDDE